MQDHISLTIPRDDDKALVAGATMLLTLANKVPELALDDAVETTAPPAAVETTAPPAAVETVKLDVHGLPWDARIHTGTKATLADGSWRYKQGVDRAVLVPQVEGELRALMTNVTPPARTASTTPPPVVAAEGSDEPPTTFPEFLKAVSGLITRGLTSMDVVNEVINRPAFGIASVQLVGSRPDLIPQIWAALVSGDG